MRTAIGRGSAFNGSNMIGPSPSAPTRSTSTGLPTAGESSFPPHCRLKYWDGNDYVPVKDAQGLGVNGNQYNTTTFGEITTSKLRLEFDSAANGLNFSTGLLQWKVYDSGNSPDFAPMVSAGVDRVVVLAGKTFLDGSVKSVKGNGAAHLIWSKVSGPGQVIFADPYAAATTASFSELGDYVLSLTAGKAPLTASDTLHVRVDPPAPQGRLEPVSTETYRINSRFWNARIKNVIVNWIPHCYTELSDVNLKEGGINNFIQAGKKLAGQPAGRHVGYPFSNAYVHNTVEAMCLALMVDPQGDQDIVNAQNAMRAKLDEWIPIILSIRNPTDIFKPASRSIPAIPHTGARRTRGEHEGYTAGYFIESAIADYEMTQGKDLRMYNAAKKLADCWYDNIGPAPKKPWYDGHEEMEQAHRSSRQVCESRRGAGKRREVHRAGQVPHGLPRRRGGIRPDLRPGHRAISSRRPCGPRRLSLHRHDRRRGRDLRRGLSKRRQVDLG